MRKKNWTANNRKIGADLDEWTRQENWWQEDGAGKGQQNHAGEIVRRNQTSLTWPSTFNAGVGPEPGFIDLTLFPFQ